MSEVHSGVAATEINDSTTVGPIDMDLDGSESSGVIVDGFKTESAKAVRVDTPDELNQESKYYAVQGARSRTSLRRKRAQLDGAEDFYEEAIRAELREQYSQSRDLLTIEAAIRDGDPEAVESLLRGMNEANIVRQLTTTYGGSTEKWDRRSNDGFFPGTSPLLHAASSGSAAMFLAVFRSMQARLDSQQVKAMIAMEDYGGRSVLTIAAGAGNQENFAAVMAALEEELTAEEVKTIMVRSTNVDKQTVLSAAAKAGDEDNFGAVMAVAKSLLSAEEVRAMITSTNLSGQTILAVAATAGCKGTFEAAMRATQSVLSTEEVEEMMRITDHDGNTILGLSAASKGRDAFEAVMTSTGRVLSDDQVKAMIMATDRGGMTILAVAASAGDKDTFGAVMSAMKTVLSAKEVKATMTKIDHDGMSILAVAALAGNKDSFEAVMTATKTILSIEEVMAMMTETAHDGTTILGIAAEAGEKDAFDAVLSATRRALPAEEVKLVMRICTHDGRTILGLAAEAGVQDTFEAVMAAAVAVLSESQLRTALMQTTKDGKTILGLAAEAGGKEAFESVMAAVETVLKIVEVDGLMRATDVSGKTILSLAALAGNRDSFETVMAAAETVLPAKEVKAMMMQSDVTGETVLTYSVTRGNKDMFGGVMAALKRILSKEEVKAVLMQDGIWSGTILSSLVTRGNKEVFEAVMVVIERFLSEEEVKAMMMPLDVRRETILFIPVKRGFTGMLEAVMAAMERLLSQEEVKAVLMQKTTSRSSILSIPAARGNKDMFKTVLAILERILSEDQVRQLIFSKIDTDTATVLVNILRWRDPSVLKTVLDAAERCVKGEKAAKEVAQEMAKGVSACTEMALETDGTKRDKTLEILSCLFQHSTRPSHEDLTKLSRNMPEWLKACCLSAVESADNPFVPGVTLSVALFNAAAKAAEGEQRKLTALQESVDNLLLEILERLPQTVDGFHGGLNGCSAVFEPEGSMRNRTAIPGPLSVALQERQQTEMLCAVPLVMDYVSRRFTWGLPNLVDSGRVLGELKELKESQFPTSRSAKRSDSSPVCSIEGTVNALVVRDGHPFGEGLSSFFSRDVLQGADPEFPSLTFLPGAQFIVTGIAAMPDRFFDVPAVRMVLDFVVYLIMLALFGVVMIFEEGTSVRPLEFAFSSYILAGAITEVRKLNRDHSVYLSHRWSILDVLGLAILASGFIVRNVDCTSPWGRALYALGSPVVFSRVLFFAQVLRFQGPMIQVISSMTSELVQFGFMMVVVMQGFVMSFYSLFRECDTYGGIWLKLFKAMLGEVGFLDDFFDDDDCGGDTKRYHKVAAILLVVYLVIMTIMLLNLLIAVLSTSHAKVQDNAEREFKVSKARLIQHYRLVVEKHLLPPPLNLVQLAVSLPFRLMGRWGYRESYASSKKVAGCVLFWLVLGPIAVSAGTLLWIGSVIYSPLVWRNFYSTHKIESGWSAITLVLGYVYVFLWCMIGAPLFLVTLWLTAPLGMCRRFPRTCVRGKSVIQDVHQAKHIGVNDMLKKAPGGLVAGELRTYLEDPMRDPEVRQDEKKMGTTVEHIKLLRDRLENTTGERLDVKFGSLSRDIDSLKSDVKSLERNVEGLISNSEGQNNASKSLHKSLDHRLEGNVERLTGSVESLKGNVDKVRAVVTTIDCRLSNLQEDREVLTTVVAEQIKVNNRIEELLQAFQRVKGVE